MKPDMRLNSIKSCLGIAFCGLCMGAADLVPGISGGTVAFILGYYEELINAIKSIRFRSLIGKTQVAWPFLLPLLAGMLLSFVTLSQPISQILNHEKWRTSLFSAFLGLVLASALICVRKVKSWQPAQIMALLATAFAAYFLTGHSAISSTVAGFGKVDDSIFDPWIMICGSIAICAMLLPGISGSYLLTVLGVYPRIIEAVADLSEGIKSFSLDVDACFLLGNFLVGIVLGAIFFSRAISWLFSSYHDLTIAMLVGFMLGALRAVWPFWSYHFVQHPLKPEKGMVLEAIAPILPSPDMEQLAIPVAFMITAFAAVVGIEFLARKISRNTQYDEGSAREPVL